MDSYHRWIWQLPEWPSLVFDAQRVQGRLAVARKSQGLLLGKAGRGFWLNRLVGREYDKRTSLQSWNLIP